MPQGGNRRHLRSLARTFAVYTQLTLKAAPQVPTIGRPFFAKSNLCRGGVSPPVCREFYLTSRRRTSEPPLCKGRCRAERGGGVVLYIDYLFLLCKLQPFTIPQALTRQLPPGGSLYSSSTAGAVRLPPREKARARPVLRQGHSICSRF